MSYPKFNRPQQDNLDSWLLTYADMITLFVCFFALLVALSSAKPGTFQKVTKDIAEQFRGSGRSLQETGRDELFRELESLMYLNQYQKQMIIYRDDKSITLDFKSTAFYEPGSADITRSGQSFLEQLAVTVAQRHDYPFNLEIEGHTDDTPISTERFPSNWELSTGRATNVVRFMIGQGLDPSRFKAIGYADTNPKLPNRTIEGRPIVENQDANRRVIIRLVWVKKDEL